MALIRTMGGAASSNPDRISYTGVYGTTAGRGVYTINGVDTTFSISGTTPVDPAGLFCSITGQTAVTYKTAGKYLEMVVGASSTSEIVDRAANETVNLSFPTGGQSYGVTIVKLD